MKPGPARPDRDHLVDAARGFAVAMMVAYHFCFDLTYYRWAAWPMLDDPRWIAWRSTIVASFLFVVGVSLALRDARERGTAEARWLAPRFVRRWLQIAGAATLVTVGSMLLFPDRFIYFGVLHFVAIAVLVCRRAPRAGFHAAIAGVALIVAGLALAHPAFDPRALNWIGFATMKPLTEDYVPLVPWLGVVLIGCAAGAWWTRRARPLEVRPPPALAWMGRWSLTIYLVHQPILLGALGAVRQL